MRDIVMTFRINKKEREALDKLALRKKCTRAAVLRLALAVVLDQEQQEVRDEQRQ